LFAFERTDVRDVPLDDKFVHRSTRRVTLTDEGVIFLQGCRRVLEDIGETMARKHPRYAPEFRRQMVELVRAGRTPEELELAPASRSRSDMKPPMVSLPEGERLAPSVKDVMQGSSRHSLPRSTGPRLWIKA
jgi:hypothetical protein